MTTKFMTFARRHFDARWAAWFGAMLLLAMVGLFPLRTALGMSDLKRIGFSARQVAGTIWYGRIGDFQLRSQSLGTFEVKLDPSALLIGNVGMQFSRMDSPEGELRGTLVAGVRRGIVRTGGRVVVADMFTPLPIEALELRDVTLLFRNGQCSEASGTVVPIISVAVPGLSFANLSGEIECEGERARVRFAAPNGNERLEFYVQANGRYRGWMTVRNVPPEIASGLTGFGFRPGPEGLVLSADGQL